MQNNELTNFGQDKMSRYNWSLADEPGEMMWIHKDALEVDMSYQREVKDTDAKVKRLAREWSWVACGALTVADRGDGRYFVIDGQHRARAALKISAVSKLPCVVFRTVGGQEEAAGFLRANKNRKPMAAIQAFKAMLKTGDKDAVFVQSLLDEHGLQLAAGGKSPHIFQAPGVILQIAARGHAHARRVMAAAFVACEGEQIHNEVLKGLAHIDASSDDTTILNRLTPRLRKLSREEILRGIANAKAFRGAGGDKVCSEGILNAVNKGLRNKIEIL